MKDNEAKKLFQWIKELGFEEKTGLTEVLQKVYLKKYRATSQASYPDYGIAVLLDIDAEASLEDGTDVLYKCKVYTIEGDAELNNIKRRDDIESRYKPKFETKDLHDCQEKIKELIEEISK